MGHLLSVGIIGQTYPPQPTFDPDRDIPDLTGKVIIVTGGNSGAGKDTVRALLKKNAKVYLATRSKENAERAINDLKADTGKEAIFLHLDLADLEAITRAANEFKSKEGALHVLFNSGGVMAPPIDMITANGCDLQFGTNVLGHAHFTLCLVPELIAGAKASSDGKARVINTSSSGLYYTRGIDYDTLKDGPKRRKSDTNILYCQSKFGNTLFSNELAKRYADHGIISNSLNPGNFTSNLTRHTTPVIGFLVRQFLQYPSKYGSLTQLWAGTSPETKDFNGEFFIPWARLGTAGGYVEIPGEGEKLWEWIEDQRRPYL